MTVKRIGPVSARSKHRKMTKKRHRVYVTKINLSKVSGLPVDRNQL